MAKAPMPSPELLRQLLEYDPETGSFIWRARPLEMFKASPGRSAEVSQILWNSKNAGEPAFQARNRDGYLQGKILGKTYGSHRVAWAVYYGQWPDGEIDHINHNIADNRISNLRVVTRSGNMRNTALQSNNKSGVHGVTFRPGRGCWVVHIHKRYIGYFRHKEDAIAARRKAEVEHGYHVNHGASLHPAVAADKRSS